MQLSGVDRAGGTSAVLLTILDWGRQVLGTTGAENVEKNSLFPPSNQVDEVSRLIQRGLIPKEAPSISGFDIAAGTSLDPGGSGRNVWSHFRLSDGRIGLVILHAQGDGLPAAHFLALARSLLKEMALDHDGLVGLLARVNSGMADAVPEGSAQHVEAGIVLPGDRKIEWASAGRCPGAVIKRDGVLAEFSSHGPPLGVLGGFLYGTQEVELGAGDAVVVLSGASQGIFRGATDLVVALQGKPVAEIVTTVQKALKKAQPDTALESSVLLLRRQ